MKQFLLIILLLFTGIVKAQTPFTLFYENGNILREWTKNKDSDTLLEKVFRENGQLHFQSQWLNNQRNGKKLIYDEQGHLIFKEFYSTGKMDGPSYTFYASGQLSISEDFKMGNLIDTAIYHAQNGFIIKKVIYQQPCAYGSRECTKQVIVFRKNQATYSFEVLKGLKSPEHKIIIEKLYLELMLAEGKLSLVKKGGFLFKSKCGMCHSLKPASIGPALNCVTKSKSEKEIMEIIEGKDGHLLTKLTESEHQNLISFIKENCPK